ncbi:MAG: hypothetical protein JW910_09985 [Anaerolineae bacterium]|nr:hypothetical protein [Anaerolineae bacterium]
MARLLRLALLVSLLAVGCTGAPVDSVDLATVPVYPTDLPLPTHRLLLDASETTIGFMVPESWQTVQDGSAAVAYVAGAVAVLPQVGMKLFTQPTSDDADMNTPLRFVQTRFLWEPIHAESQRGRFDAEYLHSEPLTPDAVTFLWGGYQAALTAYNFTHDGLGAGVVKLQIAVRLSPRDDILVLWAAVPEADWRSAEPVIMATFDSVMIGGWALAVNEVEVALAGMNVSLAGDVP